MFTLIKTCDACPEQYSVYINDKYVGQMRLRYGVFNVTNSDGENVLSAYLQGDGIFHSDERDNYLTMGCISLLDDTFVPLYTIKEK